MSIAGHILRAGAVFLAVGLALPALADERRSSFEEMSSDIQAMQQDDFLNPGMLWVTEGEKLWAEAPKAAPSCKECHGPPETMAGVAARHPSWDEEAGQAIDLEGRVNLCRTRHQSAEPLERESRPLLALTALVGHQSRGMPITPPNDPRLDPIRDRGQSLWTTQMGQLNLSCAECHDDHAGNHLVAAVIPQGHATGYPLYRLEWETLGSLDRRFQNCLRGIRAEPFAAGSPEHIALRSYLAVRAKGMSIETPAVRP